MSAKRQGSTTQAAMVLLATFILGGIAGAGLSRWTQEQPAHGPPPGGPLPIHELDLSSEQREQVDAILQRHRPQVEAVLAESRPRIEAINTQLMADVKEVLTAEQRQQLEALRSRRRPPHGKGGRSHMGPRPGGHPDMGPPPGGHPLDGPPPGMGPPPGGGPPPF